MIENNKTVVNKQLIGKLLEASKLISERGRNSEASYIQLSTETIQHIADINNISFDDAIDIVTFFCNPIH